MKNKFVLVSHSLLVTHLGSRDVVLGNPGHQGWSRGMRSNCWPSWSLGREKRRRVRAAVIYKQAIAPMREFATRKGAGSTSSELFLELVVMLMFLLMVDFGGMLLYHSVWKR